MKTKKSKTIKYPKTEAEAIDLVFKLSNDFNFKAIILSREDLDDKMGTEEWKEKHYSIALELALEEVCESVGFAIDACIDQVNKNKNLN